MEILDMILDLTSSSPSAAADLKKAAAFKKRQMEEEVVVSSSSATAPAPAPHVEENSSKKAALKAIKKRQQELEAKAKVAEDSLSSTSSTSSSSSSSLPKAIVIAVTKSKKNKKRQLEAGEEEEDVEIVSTDGTAAADGADGTDGTAAEPAKKRPCLQQQPKKLVASNTISSFLRPIADSLQLACHNNFFRPTKNGKNKAVQMIADFVVEALHTFAQAHAALAPSSGKGKHAAELVKLLCKKTNKGDSNLETLTAHSDLLMQYLAGYFEWSVSINDSFPAKRLFFDLASVRCVMLATTPVAERWQEGFGTDFALVRSISNQLRALQANIEGNLAHWMSELNDTHVVQFFGKKCGPFFAHAYTFAACGCLKKEDCEGLVENLFESIFEQLRVFIVKADEKKACE